MGGLAEYESGRFRLPKSLQEGSLFAQSNTKSTEYKEKWAVEVFRNWQVVREQKFPSVDPGSVFKDYDVYRVQSLQEKKEDLSSLFLSYLQGCAFLNSASFANCDVNIGKRVIKNAVLWFNFFCFDA